MLFAQLVPIEMCTYGTLPTRGASQKKKEEYLLTGNLKAILNYCLLSDQISYYSSIPF